jgi:aquaporin Z
MVLEKLVKKKEMKTIRAIMVEGTGTFFLCFVGGLAVYGSGAGYGEQLINVAFAHGLVLFMMIAWGGPITGAQYNPAVTIALMINGEMAWGKGSLHIVSQFVGSIAAGFALWLIHNITILRNGVFKKINTSPLLSPNVSHGQGFVLEFIATFTLVMAVFTGIRTKQNEIVIGGYVGIVLMSFINSIGNLTGASLNPARTFGPYLFYNNFVPVSQVDQPILVYYLAPILGGVVSGFVSKEVIHTEDVLEEKYTKKVDDTAKLMAAKAAENGDEDGVGELL